MKVKNREIEILAPAGSFAALRAAINAGCDAVYFGLADLNMRATAAANFTYDDLNEIMQICKQNNIKAYVTLNVLVYDDEMTKVREIIDRVKLAGVDAVIAADMAVIEYARAQGVEIHISTQMSVSNVESVKFYSKFADCIVLARELTLEKVTSICEQVREQNLCGPKGELMQIEVFAHGALCVAVSGRCSMSLYCYNASANRGRCTQVCRRKYKVVDPDTGKELTVDNNYVMSSADLCTIGMLDKLVNSGISVLKFEGRGRSPDYVDLVIRTYREALKSINEDTYTLDKILQWNKDLKTVFNRGLSQGYYMGRTVEEWSGVNGSKTTDEKVQIGLVEKYYPKAQIVQVLIQSQNSVNRGDEFMIIGPETGVVRGELTEFWLNEILAQTAKQGDVITFKSAIPVRKNDIFFILKPITRI